MFFKPLEILVSQESSYISHNPCQSLQLENVPLEDMNENVPGNTAYTVRYRQLQYAKLLRTSKQVDSFN